MAMTESATQHLGIKNRRPDLVRACQVGLLCSLTRAGWDRSHQHAFSTPDRNWCSYFGGTFNRSITAMRTYSAGFRSGLGESLQAFQDDSAPSAMRRIEQVQALDSSLTFGS